MKILIACYSYTGNTIKVANHLKEILNADLTIIEDVKNKWVLFKIWDSFRRNLIPIKPCITNLTDYDTLIVCSPVWAGRTPAAINEYLSLLKNAKDKKFGVLITAGSVKSQKATVYIREFLFDQGMDFLGQIVVLTADVKKESYKEKIDLFSRKFL